MKWRNLEGRRNSNEILRISFCYNDDVNSVEFNNVK